MQWEKRQPSKQQQWVQTEMVPEFDCPTFSSSDALYRFYFGQSGPYRRQSSFLLILIVASSSEPLLFRLAPDLSSDLRAAVLVYIITACADTTGIGSGQECVFADLLMLFIYKSWHCRCSVAKTKTACVSGHLLWVDESTAYVLLLADTHGMYKWVWIIVESLCGQLASSLLSALFVLVVIEC